MNFTFGIVTSGTVDADINTVIDSIENENIPEYEILIIGPSHVDRKNTTIIHDEQSEHHPTRKHLGWITRKKNIITKNAQHDYIVFMHDYIRLIDGWYEGWNSFLLENEFEIGVNYIYTYEGPRHADWVVCPYDMWHLFPEFGSDMMHRYDLLIPVDRTDLTKFQYISGPYWVATKEFSLQYPQLEEYGWGEAEDVWWAKKVRRKHRYKFNSNARVQLIRRNKWQPGNFPQHYLETLTRYSRWIDENQIDNF